MLWKRKSFLNYSKTRTINNDKVIAGLARRGDSYFWGFFFFFLRHLLLFIFFKKVKCLLVIFAKTVLSIKNTSANQTQKLFLSLFVNHWINPLHISLLFLLGKKIINILSWLFILDDSVFVKWIITSICLSLKLSLSLVHLELKQY